MRAQTSSGPWTRKRGAVLVAQARPPTWDAGALVATISSSMPVCWPRIRAAHAYDGQTLWRSMAMSWQGRCDTRYAGPIRLDLFDVPALDMPAAAHDASAS